MRSKKGGPGHSRQAKRVQRAACGDGHVFSPIDGEGHRRCVDCAAHLEMAKRLATGHAVRPSGVGELSLFATGRPSAALPPLQVVLAYELAESSLPFVRSTT